MTVSTEFWESLGISIDDIVDKEAEMKEGICRRLAHKLEKLSEDYFQLVKDTFKTSGDSFPEILRARDNASFSAMRSPEPMISSLGKSLAKYMLAEQNNATRNGKIEFCRRIF